MKLSRPMMMFLRSYVMPHQVSTTIMRAHGVVAAGAEEVGSCGAEVI